MATATVNELFPKIKGTITSLVMMHSSLCNYTILSAAANMSATGDSCNEHCHYCNRCVACAVGKCKIWKISSKK